MSQVEHLIPTTLSSEEHQFDILYSAPRLTLSAGSSSSNNAFHISLVTPGKGGPTTLHSFNPAMTYSIFGENETIFGYQGLKINLRYNACDMYPGLQITYNRKYKTVGEVEATDLKAVLESYLPKRISSFHAARNYVG